MSPFSTFRRSLARTLAKAPPTKRVFAAYVAYRQRRAQRKFDTCSPTMIPVLHKAFEQGVQGDYYEFGLYKGYLFWTAHECAKKKGESDMRFFGFDSFAGLPPLTSIDQGWKFHEGDYACSIDRVIAHLNKKKINWKNTFLIPGYFSESLQDPQHPFRKASIVVIDCDLYQSTKEVLTFMDPYFQNGTILMFDDWNCFDGDDERGQRKAMQEYLEQHPAVHIEPFSPFGWHGMSFRMRM